MQLSKKQLFENVFKVFVRGCMPAWNRVNVFILSTRASVTTTLIPLGILILLIHNALCILQKSTILQPYSLYTILIKYRVCNFEVLFFDVFRLLRFINVNEMQIVNLLKIHLVPKIEMVL